MIRRTILPIVAAFFLVACASCGTDNPPNNQDDCDGGDCNVIQIESCDGPSDCPIGKSCREGKCVSADAQCETDEDCGPDRRCEDGICFAKDREIRPIPDMTTADMGDDSGGSNVCNGCYLPTSGGGADAGDAGDAGTDMGADAGMGECVEGNTKEACGGGGVVCITCPGEQLCDEGTCVDPPTCDETNCDGCCSGSECVDGEAIDACGTGGMNCMECNPADQNCSQGACVDKGCSETCDGCCDGDACLSGDLDGACGWFGVACITCDTGMTCEFGNCVVDPNSRWDVEIVSATVPDKNADGDDWDSFGGLPDPFVQFKTEDSGMTWDDTTESKSNTTYAFYFETIVTDVPARALMDRWDIWVKDSDTFGSTTMGSCYGDFVQADFDGYTFPVTCPAHGDQVEVTVRLRLLPH